MWKPTTELTSPPAPNLVSGPNGGKRGVSVVCQVDIWIDLDIFII